MTCRHVPCHRLNLSFIGHSTTLQDFRVQKKRSVSHKFNNFPLIVVRVGSTRHKKRGMQQIMAGNVSSRLCHAVYVMRCSKLLCSIFFGTPEVCRVSCATCRVQSMNSPLYARVTWCLLAMFSCYRVPIRDDRYTLR